MRPRTRVLRFGGTAAQPQQRPLCELVEHHLHDQKHKGLSGGGHNKA
jgi:hypothetical protein